MSKHDYGANKMNKNCCGPIGSREYNSEYAVLQHVLNDSGLIMLEIGLLIWNRLESKKGQIAINHSFQD